MRTYMSRMIIHGFEYDRIMCFDGRRQFVRRRQFVVRGFAKMLH